MNAQLTGSSRLLPPSWSLTTDVVGSVASRREGLMDIVFVVLGLGFFAASGWFVRACAALEPPQEDKQ